MSEVLDIPHELVNGSAKGESVSPEIIVLRFADSAVPVFKEVRNKDYIRYGEDDKYVEYLTHLFNKSGKHNAIITGKADYIFGGGFENGDFTINRLGESLNDISKKAILDIEIYGGYRLEIIYNHMGKIAEIYHVDYTTIRVGKEKGFWFREKWEKYGNSDMEFMEAFNPAHPVGSQIFAYNEYRPGVRFYPLPSYIACLNYVETDIEISKYYLSAIRNGMMPSKMIQFFKGEPTEDKKKQIERRFSNKFSGAENAGKFILVFNNGTEKQVQIDDLSGTELDKMFIELNKTCQQEIFSGHKVTSPMLFGIKTEGQLGGVTELKTAYEIFVNTYAASKGSAYEKEITYLLSYSNFAGEYKLKRSDPVGLQFDVKDVIASIPKEFILEKLGVPKELWGPPVAGLPTPGTPTVQGELANDNIRNLSAKQHQQVVRIIRQYGKGQLTELAAKALLRTGYGLSEADINDLLGIEAVALSFEDQLDEVIGMFDACGESKNDFEILKSKKVCFSTDEEAAEDEAVFIHEAFKTFDVTQTENQILELIKKDPKITPKIIAEAIGETEKFVTSKIASLVKKGYLESTTEMIGTDEVIVRSIPKELSIKPPPTKVGPAQISVKYSYEVKPNIGPEIIATTRPFCRRMIALNRLYSRADIEKISLRLGYSVFDRKGGWYGNSPECRHRWQSNIVVKKGGTQS